MRRNQNKPSNEPPKKLSGLEKLKHKLEKENCRKVGNSQCFFRTLTH